MLETVREFALEQLAASNEANIIRCRHAAWYLALAEKVEIATWGGPEQARWLDRFEVELPNLRGALAWFEESGDTEATLRLVGALGGLWFHRGRRAEGHALLERALAAADEDASIGRAKVLRTLSMLGMSLGMEQAAAHAAESVAMWTVLGNAWRAADAQLALGMVLIHQADYEQASPLLEKVAAQLDGLGEPVRAAVARLHLGQVSLERGNTARAEVLFKEVLGLFRRGGYQWAVSAALFGLGQVAADRGDSTAAASYYAESLALVGNNEGLVGRFVGTARLASAGGRPETATRLLGVAVALAKTAGYVLRPVEEAQYQRVAADVRASLGDANFEAAWAAGQALPAEQAVAEAAEMLAVMSAPNRIGAAVNNGLGLTPREREVLTLLTEGHSNQEIADALFISPRTAKNHVASILPKLGAGSRAAAVAYALRHGLA
jgi:non-specific serine/threonine protein kinase